MYCLADFLEEAVIVTGKSAEQPSDCQMQQDYGDQVWQQNPWNVISNARGNLGIAKHNKATVTQNSKQALDL